MTPEKLRHNLLAIRERLSDRQKYIQRDALQSDSGRFTARAPINMAEQASDEQELDMLVSRLTASSEILVEIKEALDRLDAGHFNECEECHKEIGERRLSIQPWAKLCVNCQRKLEEEGS
jgi:DnaK suppressor protein